MPATTIAQILAWNNAIESGLAAQLEAAGVPPFQPRTRDDLPDVYAIPMFQKGASNGHLARLPLGGHEFDLFPGSVIGVDLFAPRVADELTPEGAKAIAAAYDLLEELAIRARYALRYNARNELNARFPCHELTELRPLPEVVGFDPERKLDRFELRWTCIAGVKPDAWPTEADGYTLPPRA